MFGIEREFTGVTLLRDKFLSDNASEIVNEDEDQVISCFSRITSCFSCCTGEDTENVKSSNSNFSAGECIVNAAKRWWKPKPCEDSADLVRASYVLAFFSSTLNTVSQVFFTVISLIPGSSSPLVKNIVNIDKKANKGIFDNSESKFILPSLFVAFAVTVNPYAEAESVIFKTNCLAEHVFGWAIVYAKAGTHKGRYSSEDGVKALFQRQIVSRLLFLTSTVMFVAEKVVHLAIGVLLTGCTAALLFRDKSLNVETCKYLGALDVIDEVSVGLRAIIYPWQKLGSGKDLSDLRDLLPARE